MEAYRLTRKDGAAGIDGVTAADYEAQLEANLLDLLDRIKSGRYQAPPVRRHYIPKADGSQRPLGIPTFEDKVAQRAIADAAGGRSTSRTSCPARTASGRGARPMTPCTHLRSGFMEARGCAGWWTSTSQKYFDTIAHCQLRTLPRPASHGRRRSGG